MTRRRLAFAGVITIVLLPLSGPAAVSEVERQIIVPPGWEGAYDYGYAPVIRVGEMVIVSGIPGGGDGTYEEKIRRMYARAVDLLAAAGATIEDVVELTTFHTAAQTSADLGAEFERYMPVHREFFGEHRPAWTAVGSTALLSPSAVVEMRVIAVVGSGAASRVVRPAPEPAAAPPAEPTEPAEPETSPDG